MIRKAMLILALGFALGFIVDDVASARVPRLRPEQEAFVVEQVQDVFGQTFTKVDARALTQGGGTTFVRVRVKPRVQGYSTFYFNLQGEGRTRLCIFAGFVKDGNDWALFSSGYVGRCL